MTLVHCKVCQALRVKDQHCRYCGTYQAGWNALCIHFDDARVLRIRRARNADSVKLRVRPTHIVDHLRRTAQLAK